MGFFTNDKPPGVPHVVLKLLELVGVSGARTKRYMYGPMFLVFLLLIAVPKIAFGYPDFEATIIGLAELFFQTNRFVGVLLLACYNDTLNEFVRNAESFATDAMQESEIVGQHLITKDAQMKKITRLYLTAIVLPANFYSFSPLLTTLGKYYYSSTANGTGVEFILHMEENFYGLDIRTSLSHYLIFGAIMVPTSFLCAVVGTAKLVSILSLIKYCTIYFQLITLKLQDMAQKQDFSEIRSVVRMHKGALDCAELLKNLTAPILLLQLILCVLIWSSMLLYFTVSGFGTQFINLFVLFLFDTTETFGYCYLGNQLSDESALIAQAVYDSGWENQNTALQKDFKLILLRAQKPVGITAGKFCYVNMEQFGEIVRTTYSVFVILRDQF